MKMKNKSPKEKQGNSLNEFSSTFFEPSFSNITFRKRGHDNSLEMVSDIGKEEDICSKILKFGPPEEINQSNCPDNNTEYPKTKKKRKKKNDVYEQCPVSIHHELDVDKEGCTYVNGDENESIIELGTEFESPELNCPIINSYTPNVHEKKKKKKKKNVQENPSLQMNLGKEYLKDRNEDEEPVVELGGGFESNELNYSVSNLDSLNVLNKKKKKKKRLSDDPLLKLNSSKEGFKDVKVNEDQIEGALRAESPVKKSKKKHKKLKFVDKEPEFFSCHDKMSPFKENFSIKKQKNNQLEIVSNVDLKNISSEEFSSHVGTLLNSPCKEHKRKHSQSKEDLIEINDSIDSGTLLNSPCKEHKRKHSQSKEDLIEINDSIDSPLLKKKKKIQKLMNESNLSISSKELIHKERCVTVNNLVVPNNDLTQLIAHDRDTSNFPFLNKKKKVQKLLDKSNLNMSSNEQFQDDRIDSENSEVESCNLNISQAVHLAKKHKRKHTWSSGNNNTENESLVVNNDCDEIKSSHTGCSPIKTTINKQRSSEMFVTEAKPSLLLPNSSETKLEDLRKIENHSQLKKKRKKHKHPLKNNLPIGIDVLNRDNNMESDERDSKHLKSLASSVEEVKHEKNKKNKQPKKSILFEEKLKTLCAKSVKNPDSKNSITIVGPSESKHTNEKSYTRKEVKDIKRNMPSPKNKNKIKNNIESLRNQLLKEALSGTEESEDLPPKSTKLKARIEENIDTLRKRLLKEAINDTKGAEDLPKKSSKVKTGDEKNVDTLRKRLLKEAICTTEGAGDLPQKSSKLKMKVEENVDTLRKRLLKEAISGTKGAEDLSLKSNKSKTRVENCVTACSPYKVQKDTKDYHKKLKYKLKNNLKRKHKHKSNDIDLLTDILISKALEKVSNSSTSHSSQENINLLNVEVNDVDFKQLKTSENKIARVKQLKSNLSKQKTTKVKDQESKHKREIEKIQKALLNNAIENINPGLKTSRSKLKKKVFSTHEKSTTKKDY